MRGRSATGLAAVFAAVAALAAPSIARAQTAGATLDNGTLQVGLDGLGGLTGISYLSADQLYPNSDNGLALRSGGTVSFPSSTGDRTLTTSDVGTTTATFGYDVSSLNVHVTETDTLSAARDLTRTFTFTNKSDSNLPLQAGELADTTIGDSDSGRGVLPPFASPMVAGLSPDGQLSGLVESANYPWSHWQEGPYYKIFDVFESSPSLYDSVDPNVTDNGVGAEWDTTLAPGQGWTIQVIWRFDASTRVNSTSDHDDGTCDATDCTLRDAVDNTNGNAVVTVPVGTYDLNPRLGELHAVDRALTIYGGGAGDGGTTLDGDGGTRLFEVLDGATVTLSGLRLQNGNGTAGVRAAPRALRADLTDGSGGALLVQQGGDLTLQDSEAAGNTASTQGGGIASAGTLTLLRSTVADNKASGPGGGVYASGATSVLDSTVGDNTADGTGAGIAASGPLELLSATIAGNRSGAGASGVFANGAPVTAHNSVLAGASPVCAVTPDGYVADFNVASDKTCGLPGTHEREGVDPGLGPLTLNQTLTDDQVQTRTFAPVGNSPVVDTGDNASCVDERLAGMDQLGQPRVQRGTCDVGAVEVALAAPVITSPADGSSVGQPITFRGTAPPNVDVQMYTDADAEPMPVTSDAAGNWAVTFPTLAPGTYTFQAFAIDNDEETVSFSSAPVTLTVGGLAPPQISSAPVSGSTVTLSGRSAPQDAITILEGSTPVGSTTADQNGNWTVVLRNVAPGSHTYTAVANFGSANQSPASQPQTVNVPSAQAATPTPTPVPTATPTPTATPLPPPVTGKKVNAQTKSGTVKVRLPGSRRYIVLGPGQQIPTGTVVDTTHGRITLTTAVRGGKTQHADFYKGVFKVTQSRGRKPLTTLSLAGPKPTCTRPKKKKHKAHATAAKKRKHSRHKKRVKSRRLWGSGHGSFRTKGQYSSATVRGTTWLTQDTCSGTLTRVTHGVVQVRDFRRHKKVLVRAGHRYLARAKHR